MNRISFLFFFTIIVAWHTGLSQSKTNTNNFISPLSGPIGITGSFGEIRSDHFHSGTDLRTDGIIGKEVRATNDGYISRIRVSSVGYGKSVFIDHPEGLTSVYGHLDRYNDQVNEYVKRIQYQLKSFDIDVFPKANEFPIKKGDLIAYSGNSGGSGGPHLHYELRTTSDQRIIDPIPQYLLINDSLAPIIRSLHIYELDSSSFSNGYPNKTDVIVFRNKDNYTINNKVKAYRKIGIGIDAFDKLNYLSTICGFNNISLFVNGRIVYRLTLDKFSFAETRYVNSIIDYATKNSSGKEIVKLFAEPNNFFSGLHNLYNKGIINILPDSLYRIEIQVGDASKNVSKLNFDIQGVTSPEKINPVEQHQGNFVYLSCMIDNTIINDTFILQIPKYSLYNNLYFRHSSKTLQGKYYSPIVELHDPKVPLHQKAKLDIKAFNLPIKYQGKALLSTYDSNQKIVAVGGEWKNGSVSGSITSFGDYFITIDTVTPNITPINVQQGMNLSNSSGIKVIVRDDFSGIGKIDGFIDGKWVLFDYDKKNNLIEYKFDKERLIKNTTHSLEIVVRDIKNNESRFKCDFIW